MPAIRLFAFVLLAAFAPGASAQTAAVEFRIAEAHPALAGQVGLRQQLFVRLAYRSSQPARFWIEAFAGGERVRDGSSSNVQPLYRAGEGEALVWIAFAKPTQIDEVRISAAVDGWKPAATVRAPAPLQWADGIARRPWPQWAERLNREQQEMVTRAAEARQSDDAAGLGGLLVTAAFLSIPAYLVLQPLLIWLWAGGWRIVALVPLIATIPLFGHALIALAAGSNLWPILLIFFIPFAFLYLVIAVAVRYLWRTAAPG